MPGLKKRHDRTFDPKCCQCHMTLNIVDRGLIFNHKYWHPFRPTPSSFRYQCILTLTMKEDLNG